VDDYQSRVVELLKRVYPFRILEEADLVWIAEAGEVLRFDPGQDFYDQGQPAEYFHLILEGDINLSFNTGKMEVSMGVVEDDDQFGVEVVESQALYLTSALAVSEGLLFRLHRETVLELLHHIPALALPLQMQAHSLRLSLEVNLDWRATDETVFYIDRRHPYFMWLRLFFPIILFIASLTILTFLAFANLPGTLLPGFAAGLASFLAGLWVIWNYVDWSNDYSIITNRRVIFQERVVLLYDSRQEAPLTAVLSNKIESSQFGRIIGYGDLILKTFTGTLAFPDLRHPEVVANLLEDRRKRVIQLHERAERRTLRKLIRRRLGFVTDGPSQQAPVIRQLKPWSLSTVLANILRMRWEQNGVITYRKHWILLLQTIFFPGLLFVVVALLAILGALRVLPLLEPLAMLGLGAVGLLLLGFWCWYTYEDWANDQYIVSDDQIIDIYKKPLGEEEKQVAPVRNIQSVEFERQGILGLVLNYGTVFIRIGDTRFSFDMVYDPSDVQRDLFVRIDRLNYREKQREAMAARLRMVDALEAYHAVIGDPYERTDHDDVKRLGGNPPQA